MIKISVNQLNHSNMQNKISCNPEFVADLTSELTLKVRRNEAFIIINARENQIS